MTRVRFAPSPTGYLHVGGVRTALFNYLFARKNKGVFVLRIEDTDEVRSTETSTIQIIESLNWLGFDWDEGPFIKVEKDKFEIEEKGDYGPYFQSKRKEIYKNYIEKLIRDDKAYYCYCTPEELKNKREEALKQGRKPGYDGHCRNLKEEEKKEKIEKGVRPALRLKVPEDKEIRFKDIIKGEIIFNSSDIEDFVIVKSSGIPTYNFACVIDDYEMKITHVIRGDDHISNTPKQILISCALGIESPQFAHLPMILGSDKTRLSKRHGATSIDEFKNQGYVPEALINYLALLGWGTEDSQQIFSKEELIEKFSLERCSKSRAVFDYEKLIWLNGYYIRNMDVDEIIKRASYFLERSGLKYEEEKLKEILILEKEKIKLLKDIPYLVSFFFLDDFEIEEDVKKRLHKFKDVEKHLKNLIELLKKVNFQKDEIEKVLREYVEKEGIKAGEIIHPVRYAVSGRTKGPSLFEMLEVLGKEKVLKRIKRFLEWLKKN